MAETKAAPPALTRKDFISDQIVRWCPGCGDFAILAQTQKFLPTLNIPREKFVFISGIGCAARFPYYVDTYGFHSIHGRAPAIATGVKCANPDLSVWVVTGDGDSLSIGTNHLIHALRRNIGINILLFNNEVYGLTKGQTSPTSRMGTKTKSTPYGSIQEPMIPVSIALAAEATFVARTFDTNLDHLSEMLLRAARHKGTAFIEILQNCKVFNDGAFADITERSHREETTLTLSHGKPLVFGKEKNKGIRLRGYVPEIVEFEPGRAPPEILVHDEKHPDSSLAYLLSKLYTPKFPVPIGVFRDVERPTYEELMRQQIEAVKKSRPADLQALIAGAETWQVPAERDAEEGA
ncbi:MAG: 2-oxoacid:ferredoxin oxidoreductase subunit beta [Elusimicrobia bacterium RIFCSPLOWO2_12_FULL_59_9]|nr:MAG: 2-oxoacid:ferredoxin oxidoreductase subunit beta [Elusimicrobia bacterium RIFCSPLOWO2_12_FULL_59_9]